MSTMIKKILIVTAFALFLSPQAFAAVEAGENEYDSIYRYNALESQLSYSYVFPDFQNTGSVLSEDSTASDEEADKADDVAKKLEDLTEKQRFSMEQIDAAMEALKKENIIKTLLVGNNLGILRFQLAQINDLIYLLRSLADENEDESQKAVIDREIKVLKDEHVKVEKFVLEQEKKFSLFGWVARML